MSLDRTALIMKIVAGVVAIIVTGFVIIKLAVARSRRKSNSSSGNGGGSKDKGASKADIRKWYRAALDKIVAARLEKESSTESGEPVFLSHYLSHGQFHHWVLHAHGHKYELRQREADDSNIQGRYAAAIGPSAFDLKAYKQSVITSYSPEVGNYFYSMIGWTTLSKEQVDEECRRVSATFGTYALLSNNCHDFLQQLADTIVTTKAPDWDWFRQNTGQLPLH